MGLSMRQMALNMMYYKNSISILRNILLLEADGINRVSSGFKRVYLGRYKLVFYVFYIHGFVLISTNIFSVSRLL